MKKMKKNDENVSEVNEIPADGAEDLSVDPVVVEAEAVNAEIPEALISEPEAAEQGPDDSALAALQAERDALQDQLLRARAEFDNYRKRMLREGEQLRKTAAQGLMRDLLPIVDNLERALGHVEDKTDSLALGVEMILKQFANVLSNQGLEAIPAKGEPFDPNIHEALTHQPSSEYPADTVMEEFQRGYRLGDFVLRPTQVVVSSGPPAAAEAPESPAEA